MLPILILSLILGGVTIDLDQAIADRLAANNLRYTEGRQSLVKAIVRASGPQTAEDLHRKLRRKMSLASLYRSLGQMQEAGVFTALYNQGRIARFELADWLTGHHHHLVCDNCGKIIELDLGRSGEEAIDKVLKAAAKAVGFQERDHLLEIVGLCSDCTA